MLTDSWLHPRSCKKNHKSSTLATATRIITAIYHYDNGSRDHVSSPCGILSMIGSMIVHNWSMRRQWVPGQEKEEAYTENIPVVRQTPCYVQVASAEQVLFPEVPACIRLEAHPALVESECNCAESILLLCRFLFCSQQLTHKAVQH